MIRNVLVHLNIDDVADFTTDNSFLNSIVKRGISQNVANHNLWVIPLCTHNDCAHFLLVRSKRLFKQHIVSCVEKGNGCFKVLLVHSAVDYRVGKFALFRKLLCSFKAHILSEAEVFHCLFAPYRIRVCNADYFKHFGIGLGKLAVNERPVTCAYDYSCYWSVFHSNYLEVYLLTDYISYTLPNATKIKNILHFTILTDSSLCFFGWVLVFLYYVVMVFLCAIYCSCIFRTNGL